MDRERPRRGWDCRAHPNRPPCRMRHAEHGGRSRPRPQTPVRHARSGDCATNAGTPATCGIGTVHVRNALFVHNDLDVTCAPPDRHRERSRPPPSHRFPPVDREAPARPWAGSFPARFREECHALRTPSFWRRRRLSAIPPAPRQGRQPTPRSSIHAPPRAHTPHQQRPGPALRRCSSRNAKPLQHHRNRRLSCILNFFTMISPQAA